MSVGEKVVRMIAAMNRVVLSPVLSESKYQMATPGMAMIKVGEFGLVIKDDDPLLNGAKA